MKQFSTSVIDNIWRGYRLVIVPILNGITATGAACRFHPTCSVYCRQALQKYGPFRGIYKCLYRLIRCHPLSPGGYDPV